MQHYPFTLPGFPAQTFYPNTKPFPYRCTITRFPGWPIYADDPFTGVARCRCWKVTHAWEVDSRNTNPLHCWNELSICVTVPDVLRRGDHGHHYYL